MTARGDVIGGAGWMAFGAAVCVEAWRMDRFDTMGATLWTMPGFMPALVGATLMALGAALAVRGLRGAPGPLGSAAGAPREPLLNRRVGLMLALCLTYAAGLVGHVPFWLATAVFVAAFTWLFTPAGATPLRRALAAGAAGVLTSLAVVLVFEQVFLVRLP
jgi:hypothetical protein